MNIEKYICSCCALLCETERTREDAQKEVDELFPGQKIENMARVCEECFIKIMKFNEPDEERYKKWIE